MKIVKLQGENIKVLKAFEISPDADSPTVKLSGKNGAGKSSVMDAIAYALGGKALIPDDPIRRGENEAVIKVELDDFFVTRTFKRDGSDYKTVLKVVAKDGTSHSNGQEVMNSILGKLSFDPLEFSMMKPKEQADLLKGMVDLGFDPAEWRVKYDKLYEKRRDANRETKRIEGNFKAMDYHEDLPDKEVSVSDITAELKAAHEEHSGAKVMIQEIADSEYNLNVRRQRGKEIEDEIKELEARLSEKKREHTTLIDAIKHDEDALAPQRESLEKLESELPDIDEIQGRFTTVDEPNKKIRGNVAWKATKTELLASSELAEGFYKKLKAHEAIKSDAIQNANYPVEGLEFADDELNYKDFPLSEASDGQKIMISTMIAMALNPELKVIFIRNASLIDSENFKIITDLAAKNEYQVWCEFMDETGEIGFFIEDGEIAK